MLIKNFPREASASHIWHVGAAQDWRQACKEAQRGVDSCTVGCCGQSKARLLVHGVIKFASLFQVAATCGCSIVTSRSCLTTYDLQTAGHLWHSVSLPGSVAAAAMNLIVAVS